MTTSMPMDVGSAREAGTPTPVIRIQQVKKVYSSGENRVYALRGVDLTVQRGEIFGLLGANGSGKSTLIRLVSTLLIPDGGAIRVFGYDVQRDERAVRRLINRVSVEASFFKKLSALENLMYAARLYDLPIHAAREHGVRALGVTLWAPPSQVGEWIDLYRQAVRSSKKPVGAFVNDQIAFFTFVHCADTDEEAMRNGAAMAAAWYTNNALTFFEAKEVFLKMAAEQEALLKDPAGGGLTGQFLRDQAAKGVTPPNQAQIVLGRIMQGETVSDEEVFDALSVQDSLIVGSPETCRRKMKVFEDLGIDRLMCFQQVGPLPHDKVMKSIRLVGEMIRELDPR